MNGGGKCNEGAVTAKPSKILFTPSKIQVGFMNSPPVQVSSSSSSQPAYLLSKSRKIQQQQSGGGGGGGGFAARTDRASRLSPQKLAATNGRSVQQRQHRYSGGSLGSVGGGGGGGGSSLNNVRYLKTEMDHFSASARRGRSFAATQSNFARIQRQGWGSLSNTHPSGLSK